MSPSSTLHMYTSFGHTEAFGLLLCENTRGLLYALRSKVGPPEAYKYYSQASNKDGAVGSLLGKHENLQSSEPAQKPGRAAHIWNSSAGGWRKVYPCNPLAIQPCRIHELQVHCEMLSQKIRWQVIEEDRGYLHLASTYTQTHTTYIHINTHVPHTHICHC